MITMMVTNPKSPTCPRCRSKRVVEITYGYPPYEEGERAQRGEIKLGGCMVGRDGGDPDRACQACGHEWRAQKRVGR